MMKKDNQQCRVFCSDKVVTNETDLSIKDVVQDSAQSIEQCVISNVISNQYYAGGGTLIYHVPQNDFIVENHLVGFTNSHDSTKCQECGIWFNLESTLKLHNTIVHNGGKGFQCDVCLNVFSQKQLFESHRLTHADEKLFKCTVCSRGFKRLANMKRHSMTHGQEKDYFCEFCGKGFYFKESLKKHHTTHNRERPYQCRHCNYLCKTLFQLEAHKKVHLEKKDNQSDLSMKDVLEKSKAEESDNKKIGTFECLICKEKFLDKPTLNIHYMEHTGINTPINDIGKTMYTNKNVGVGVIKSIKYREVEVSKQGSSIPVECELCKQIFRTSNELKEHERIHTSDNILKTCLDMKNEVINLLPALI